jgi:hypothetical protein
MAVAIDEMQVDIEKRPTASTPAEKPKPKETLDLSRELRMRTERELRLRAD